jgi:hypothetical protein
VPVTGSASLVDDAGAAQTTVAWRLDRRESAVDLRLPLADLVTGPYRLVIAATDGTSHADRTLGLRVEQNR